MERMNYLIYLFSLQSPCCVVWQLRGDGCTCTGIGRSSSGFGLLLCPSLTDTIQIFYGQSDRERGREPLPIESDEWTEIAKAGPTRRRAQARPRQARSGSRSPSAGPGPGPGLAWRPPVLRSCQAAPSTAIYGSLSSANLLRWVEDVIPLYTLDELKLNGIDTSSFLAPLDQTLGSIDTTLQIALAFGAASAFFAFHLSQLQLLFLTLPLLFLWTLDQISFNGGLRNLLLDTIGHAFSPKYHNRVIQHEAGHFIIAYLLGVLPKSYTITSLETLTKEGSLNVQAGTAFVDFEFLEEINSGKVSAKMLNSFSCIALAGVATEYLLYGYAEGGLDDIAKLDGLLKSLGFTQKKADSQVRWAVLNTILILRRHEKARLQLAAAMSDGRSVGSCIDVIESNIDFEDI